MEKLEAQKKDLTDMAECLRQICMNQEKDLKKLKLKKQVDMLLLLSNKINHLKREHKAISLRKQA